MLNEENSHKFSIFYYVDWAAKTKRFKVQGKIDHHSKMLYLYHSVDRISY